MSCTLEDMVYVEAQDERVNKYEVDSHGVPTHMVVSQVVPGAHVYYDFFCYNCQRSFLDWPEALAHLANSIPEGCPHMNYTENEMDGTGVCNDCGREFRVPPGGWMNA